MAIVTHGEGGRLDAGPVELPARGWRRPTCRRRAPGRARVARRGGARGDGGEPRRSSSGSRVRASRSTASRPASARSPTSPIPPDRREELQRALRPLARRRHGAAGRARGGAGDDAAAGPHAGDGLLRRAAGGGRGAARRCSTPASRPVVPEHGSLGASGDLAPLAHCALVLLGEGEVRRRPTAPRRPAAEALARRRASRPSTLDGQGGPGAHQRHRRHARHAACSRSHDLERAAARSPTSPRR